MKIRQTFLFILAALAIALVSAGCGTVKIAGQPIGAPAATATNTRAAARPTFTLPPPATDTPTPTDTPVPTNTSVATATATRRPNTSVPTRPPATAAPQPTSAPVATVSPYTYKLIGQECRHSGQTFIEVFVFSNYAGGSGDKIDGVKVRGSYVPDGPPIGEKDELTKDGGKAQFTLSGNGPRPGTWYVWIVGNTGNRISPLSNPINTNALNEDAPGSCWNARVAFAITP